MVSLDVKNAFNTIHREAFLDGVSQDFPELLKWTSWAYGQPSKLYYKDACFASTNGTKQGEPMGGALFSIGTNATNKFMSNAFKEVSMFAFFDDYYLLGEQTETMRAVKTLSDRLKQIGML